MQDSQWNINRKGIRNDYVEKTSIVVTEPLNESLCCGHLIFAGPYRFSI